MSDCVSFLEEEASTIRQMKRDIVAIVGTSVPIPMVAITTIISLLVDRAWINAILMLVAVVVSIGTYCLCAYISPTVQTVFRKAGTEDIDPGTVIMDATSRTVTATYYVTCSHGNGDITHLAAHTYEIEHMDTTEVDTGTKVGKITHLTLYPDIQVDDECRSFLEGIKQNLYRYYKGRDKYCNVKYMVEIPGLSHTSILASDSKHILLSKKVMGIILCTIVLTPLYLLICRLNTKVIRHPISKKISPTVKEGYPMQ